MTKNMNNKTHLTKYKNYFDIVPCKNSYNINVSMYQKYFHFSDIYDRVFSCTDLKIIYDFIIHTYIYI